jgi:hypothetical protein
MLDQINQANKKAQLVKQKRALELKEEEDKIIAYRAE